MRLPGFLRPDPPAEPLPGGQVAPAYALYRRRILVLSLIGYATFYFIRKNLPTAMPALGEELHIGKPELGLFLTLHGVLYGVSKFANGFLGDRANARTFLALGLLLSAAMNVCFGFSSTVLALGMFWVLNGWFQGMGFPPCARLLTHWFTPKELATKMSLWNISHSIGAGAIFILCGYLIDHYGNWRLCFFVPSAIAGVVAVVMLAMLRDTPASVGLPPVDAGTGEASDAPPEDFKAFVRRMVFGNPWIWLLSVANFFVYTIRYAVMDWGPTMLKESHGVTLTKAGWMIAAFEVAGLVGMLASGWLTDRIFGGRGARMCVFCMILCGGALLAFAEVPPGHAAASTGLLMVAGFAIYGPQALVGICAANLATRHAAATAVGLTGIFGYASGVLSGVGLGWLVEQYGWPAALGSLVGVSVAAMVCFALAWAAPRDGYARLRVESRHEPERAADATRTR